MAKPTEYLDNWKYGFVRVDQKGRRTFIIRVQREGKRPKISTGAHNEKTALEEYERWFQDPDGYRPRAGADGQSRQRPVDRTRELVDSRSGDALLDVKPFAGSNDLDGPFDRKVLGVAGDQHVGCAAERHVGERLIVGIGKLIGEVSIEHLDAVGDDELQQGIDLLRRNLELRTGETSWYSKRIR
ncbi:MAG: hypothetical protein K1X64_23455 [Myxococcaceae bacterium]|nr:hypothetical protein [Myxococcaceae bacterium]